MSLSDAEKTKTTDFNLAEFLKKKTTRTDEHKIDKINKEKHIEKIRLKSPCKKVREDDDDEDEKDHWTHPKRKGQTITRDDDFHDVKKYSEDVDKGKLGTGAASTKPEDFDVLLDFKDCFPMPEEKESVLAIASHQHRPRSLPQARRARASEGVSTDARLGMRKHPVGRRLATSSNGCETSRRSSWTDRLAACTRLQ